MTAPNPTLASYDVQAVRADFPVLERRIHGQPLVFLDSAASSQKPLPVVQAINGAGDTYTPTVIDFFGFWVLQLPLAYWLATSAGLGPNGAFTAIVVAETFVTILGVIIFRRGRWKKVRA